MTLLPRRGTIGRTLVRLRRAGLGEAGFTLVETLMAALILLIIATSLAGVLTSSIAAHTVSRERTVAEQTANDQVESIRRLPYDSIGVVSGNPPGTVAATKAVNVNGLAATVTTDITYVDDPAPSSYATAANYKRVIVTVTRDKDSKVLTKVSTFIAPPARAPYGGINNAIINVQVLDFALNTQMQGATVSLQNGPSSNRTGVTDTTGSVSFAALTPNPTSGPQAYYDLTAALGGGYQTLADDLPPNAPAHVQLAPSQTFNTTLRIFKPATINIVTQDAGGSPYTGQVDVTVYSAFRTTTTPFTVTGGSLAITTLGSEPVLPGVNYTVVGKTTTGLCADPAPTYVPDNYPSVLSTTFTLTLTPCPSGTLAVDATQYGAPADGATVTVTGGPNNMSFNGTTDGAGNVTFTNVPSGATTYTVTASKYGQSANTTATITTGATTNTSLVIPDPPSGTVVANVDWAGLDAAGASVTLSGGPYTLSLTGTADANGQVTFVNIPAGSGYVLDASKNTGTGSTSGITVVASSSVSPVVDLTPTKSLRLLIRRNSVNAPNTDITISVTGGPNGTVGASPVYTLSGTTDANAFIWITLPAVTASSTYFYTVRTYMTGCPAGVDRNRTVTNVDAVTTKVTQTMNMTSDTCPGALP